MDKKANEEAQVIEGRGQVVAPEYHGWWLRQRIETGHIRAIELGDKPYITFEEGFRYMRCPTFPPRPVFTAPEKPELVLVRPVGKQSRWATKATDGDYVCSETGTIYPPSEVELLNPATGEVL